MFSDTPSPQDQEASSIAAEPIVLQDNDIEAQLSIDSKSGLDIFDKDTYLDNQKLYDCIGALQDALQEKSFKAKQKARIYRLIPTILFLFSAGGMGYFIYDVIRRFLIKDAIFHDWESYVFDAAHYGDSTCATINPGAPFDGDFFCTGSRVSAGISPQYCVNLANEFCSEARDSIVGWETAGLIIAGLSFLSGFLALVCTWINYKNINFDFSELRLKEFFDSAELVNLNQVANNCNVAFDKKMRVTDLLAEFEEYITNLDNMKKKAYLVYCMARNGGPEDITRPGLPKIPWEIYYHIFKYSIAEELDFLQKNYKKREANSNEGEKETEKETEVQLASQIFNRFFKRPLVKRSTEPNITPADVPTYK